MRQSVLRTRRRQLLWTGATAALLGVPLTLSAAGTVPATTPTSDNAPAVLPAAASTDAVPVAASSSPQFHAERYESEVQRQLHLLYQQDPRSGSQSAGAPVPPPNAGPPKPRKLKFKEYFNPTAWKKHYARQQRYNDYQRRMQEQQAGSALPEAELGSPVDMTLGQPARLAPATTIPPIAAPIRQPAPSVSAAPAAPLAPPSANRAAPASPRTPSAAPAAALPKLEKVSPELFGDWSSTGNSASAEEGPTFELLLPTSPTETDQPQLLPSSTAAAPSPIDGSVPQTPMLIIVPNPDEPGESGTAALTQAPPAEVADAENPFEQPEQHGFFNDTTETFALPTAAPSPEPQELTEFQPPTTAEENPSTFGDDSSGPFTGLELESNPFVDPPADLSAAAPLEAAPAASRPITVETSLPADAGALTVDDQPGPMLFAPSPLADKVAAPQTATPAQIDSSFAASTAPSAAATGAPAALASPATGRALPASSVAANRAVRPDVQQKLEQISARQGLTGFKGFCPVMLTDYRELVDAKLEYTAEHEGRRYWFSSAAARETFMLDPTVYAPARGGIDVVIFDRNGESREGSLDHAVWYRGKLYLFDSAESRAAFTAAPQDHMAAR